jgi:hypothetical protein
VHSGGGRVDPFGGDKGERSEHPCGDQAEGEAEKNESDAMLPARRLGGWVWLRGHTSG